MKMQTHGPKFPLGLDGDAEEHASGKYLKLRGSRREIWL
jgi:hypothetical protein